MRALTLATPLVAAALATAALAEGQRPSLLVDELQVEPPPPGGAPELAALRRLVDGLVGPTSVDCEAFERGTCQRRNPPGCVHVLIDRAARARADLVATPRLVRGPGGHRLELLVRRGAQGPVLFRDSEAGGDPARLAQQLAERWPGWCQAVWQLTLRAQSRREQAMETHDKAGDIQTHHQVSGQVVIESTYRFDALGGGGRATHRVSGQERIEFERRADALCGGGQGPERLVPGGHKEHSLTRVSYGPAMADDEAAKDMPPVAVTRDKRAGRLTISFNPAQVRYQRSLQFEQHNQVCDERQDQSGAGTDEESGGPTPWTHEMPLPPLGPNRTLRSSGSIERQLPGPREMRVSERLSWDFGSQPLAEVLASGREVTPQELQRLRGD